MNLKPLLEKKTITASVPCRVDLGGTLDIATFYLPLNRHDPSSFNIALDLRTHVTLSAWEQERVRISSRGFETAEFHRKTAPYDHPMGLMFAIADYFDVHGVHIHIESTSPPRSALGGSSSAAVAIVSALCHALGKRVVPAHTAWLAHYIEASVAGVPCGVQDQLAAAFGGVHQWQWGMGDTGPVFKREPIFTTVKDETAFNSNILIAYCGIPHVSKDVNKQWVASFIAGNSRQMFEKIATLANDFSAAVKLQDFRLAAGLMNQETRLRLDITPEVLDNTGKKLFERAIKTGCGARFTGAGGGGCLWAVGEAADIEALKPQWNDALASIAHAEILDTHIDNQGIILG